MSISQANVLQAEWPPYTTQDPLGSNLVLAVPFTQNYGLIDISPRIRGEGVPKKIELGSTNSRFNSAIKAFSIYGSAYVAGSTLSSNRLFVPNFPAFGSTGFTIETRLYISNFGFGQFALPIHHNGANTGFQVLVTGDSFGTPNRGIYVSGGNNAVGSGRFIFYTTANVLPLNTWFHLAISRQGNLCRIFIDGVNRLSFTEGSFPNLTYTGDLGLISAGNASAVDSVHIQDLRIYQGVTKYWDNFSATPPTPILTDVAPPPTPAISPLVDLLVVGGGGGGGFTASDAYRVAYGGGGGAGGLYYNTFELAPGTYTVKVGTGGGPTVNGTESYLGTYIAPGGGAGGDGKLANGNNETVNFSGEAGNNGGSGGGGGGICSYGGNTRFRNAQPGINTVAGLGFRGGYGAIVEFAQVGSMFPSYAYGGGGGGATSVGIDGFNFPSFGGGGLSLDITGTSKIYAVGGYGYVPGSTEPPNTGNGGWVNATGGSGVVIVRYEGPRRADGGTITSYTANGKTYTVHSFTSTVGTSTFVLRPVVQPEPPPPEVISFSLDYLVVAGGGAGGHGASDGGGGGGGGGGGVRSGTGFQVSSGANYNITVGGGGASTSFSGGANGGSSIFSTITATGGGGGGSKSFAGKSGGSGGGGGERGAAGTGVSGQGRNGGAGSPIVPGGGGGGGGAGLVGGDAPTNQRGGNGGDGVPSTIQGFSTYFAGGGAGAPAQFTSAWGNPGSGGGGFEGNKAGVANSGGGGAGLFTTSSGNTGGSGVVIIAYPDTNPPLSFIDPGLVYTTPTRAGYRVYRFIQGTGTIRW